MINIIFCIKSKESYKRIANTLKIDENFDIEEHISNLEALQESISIKQYDLAIIDEKLAWKEEALDLFNKASTKIVLFKGDFKKTIGKIYEAIPKSEIEEEKKRKEKTPYYNGVKYKKISHTEASEPAKEDEKTYKRVNHYTGIENKLIIVAGLCPGSGSTFLATNLAKALTDLKIRTAVIEPPLGEPFLYYRLGIGDHLKMAGPETVFYSYPHIIHNGFMPKKGTETVLGDIIWAITDPEKGQIKGWDSDKMMQLLYAVKRAPVTIVDIGSRINHASADILLSHADMILVLINADPAYLKQNEHKINDFILLKKKGLPIKYVINFATSAINRKEVLKSLKAKDGIFIPAIPVKSIQEAHAKSRFPLEIAEVEEKLFNPLSAIIKDIIPLEVFSKIHNHSSGNGSGIVDRIKQKTLNLKKVLLNK